MSNPSGYTVFQNQGHPGRWTNAVAVTTSDVSFSGSAIYGGVITSGSSAALTHEIQLSDGGTIPANLLTKGVVYEFSIQYVTGGSNGTVYVLKRNG